LAFFSYKIRVGFVKKSILLLIFLLAASTTNAYQISIFPEIWFEINNQASMTLIENPEAIYVGWNAERHRGFWEYDISTIRDEFINVDSAYLKIPNKQDNKVLTVHYYQAEPDLKPELSDWERNNRSFYNSSGYFSNPESSVDITMGFKQALESDYEYLGLLLLDPNSWVGGQQYWAMFEPASNAEIIITGTPVPVPEPSTLLMTGLSLFIASRYRKKFKRN
jgi:hypothetical protein